MVFVGLANAVNLLANFLTILVLISVILSWFMSPYHPLRAAIDRIVDPMLNPIRRVVPTAGMFDFSPLILIILIEFLARVLTSILLSL
ncbi:MAG: YggT family protein [Chloroflexi bacterium]|nr:YggT family protein [Chloroflexota bacterium]